MLEMPGAFQARLHAASCRSTQNRTEATSTPWTRATTTPYSEIFIVSELCALAFTDARCARQYAWSFTQAKPLKIWILALPFDRIVMTAKKLALAAHH